MPSSAASRPDLSEPSLQAQICLQIARRWLDGSVSGGKQDCPAAVLRELSAAIQLCDPAPTNHIVDGEGFVPLALSQSMQVRSLTASFVTHQQLGLPKSYISKTCCRNLKCKQTGHRALERYPVRGVPTAAA